MAPCPAVNAAADDAIGRILLASTPAEALLTPGDAPMEASMAVAARYRHLVARVHPDCCVDPRAGEAFGRASRAFDALCAQEAAADETLDSAGDAWDRSMASPGSCWWDAIGSADELDRLLEYRHAASETLLGEIRRMDADVALAALRVSVLDAERACEHLDRLRGFPFSRLWPDRRRVSTTPNARNIQAVDKAKHCTARYLDLLLHLRAVHRFCPLSRRSYDHAVQLEAGSPPCLVARAARNLVGSDAHLELASRGGCEEGQADGQEDVEMEDADCDPLDAYMAKVEAELRTAPAGKRLRPLAATEGPTKAAPVEPQTGPTAARAAPAMPPSVAPFGFPAAEAAPVQPSQQGAAQAVGGCRPWRSSQNTGVLRLATGGVVALAAESGREAQPAPGLQDELLGDLGSDGSEVEEG
mmetsp:Transcript_6915/g.14974  ORF Transcript_6915/g.14974 Transcript_6915/m.14974 type:complete len:415 (-) Transcript_6915:65-1309(-)